MPHKNTTLQVSVTSDTGIGRRGSRLRWAAASLACGAGLLLASCSSPQTLQGSQTPPDRQPVVFENQLPITVTRVSDGDSLRAQSEFGELEIRLLGINAPESDECFGDASRELLEGLVESAPSLSLAPWPAELDQFGRTLAHLVTPSANLNLAMLDSGGAFARSQSDHTLVEEFENAEHFAAENALGLWSACESSFIGELAISALNADAEGNDNLNPNGEWVEIANMGDATVDLDGWSVRDESTRHRYTFDGIALTAGSTIRLFSGCGTDDLDSDPMEVYWCDPQPPIWNNDGDTGFLLDATGQIVTSRRTP